VQDPEAGQGARAPQAWHVHVEDHRIRPEALLEQGFLHGRERACDSDNLGLLGDPAALKVEVVRDNKVIDPSAAFATPQPAPPPPPANAAAKGGIGIPAAPVDDD
jgi:hypothetical protein